MKVTMVSAPVLIQRSFSRLILNCKNIRHQQFPVNKAGQVRSDLGARLTNRRLGQRLQFLLPRLGTGYDAVARDVCPVNHSATSTPWVHILCEAHDADCKTEKANPVFSDVTQVDHACCLWLPCTAARGGFART